MLFRQDRNGGRVVTRRDQRGNMPSVLGADVKVEGDVITDGDLFIGGSVKGHVVAQTLTVAENASLTGIVEANTVIVSGALSGKLAANVVTLKRTASVSADITHVQLTVETGASFEGYSRRVASLEAVTDRHENAQVGGPAPMPALTAEAAE